LLIELDAMESRVFAIDDKEFRVGTPLNDFSVLKNQDLIGCLNR
jgi:hypothetical protein